MSVGAWLGEVAQAVQAGNTGKLSACLDARNEHAQACLHRAQFTPEQLRQVANGKLANARVDEAEKWATLAAEHLLTLQLSQQGKHGEAVERYAAATEALRRLYAREDGESSWLDQVVIDFSKSVVQVARRATKVEAAGTEDALKRAGGELRTMRKDAFQRQNAPVLLSLTVQCYKLYFAMGSVFLMKDLHLQLKEFELGHCPRGDLCSYKFFRGMLELLEERWQSAEANLTTAFNMCDPQHQRNLGKILSYLVPVQILRGNMPRDDMLRKYQLGYFAPVVAALKKGDPVELEAALDAEQARFVRRGIYLAMGKLHVLAFRTLLKRVHQCQLELGGHATQLRLDSVTACCERLGMDVDMVEVQCMVNTLIARKLVKGYVALPQQILVVQKGGPQAAFPHIGGASWG